ncbi:Chromate resistance protein ChrB [Streptomyces monashensis]|uniref:Chromate resistance protein ChrB n=1 Tax=Streptomyces monashensis TaxID=1678012 RepID=UPI0033E27A7E
MSNVEPVGRRLALAIRLPAQPSRHRVGVWRELRRIGTLSPGQGIWAVPDVPVLADGIARAVALTEQAAGQVVTLTASGRGTRDAALPQEMFDSLERLRHRHRHRHLTARDMFGTPEAAEARRRLKRCVTVCEDYAERVFTALHQTPETER